MVKSVFNNNKHASIPTLVDNGIHYTHDTDKAELLNNYFVSQSVLPASDVALPPFYYLTPARLDQIAVTPEAVKKILLSLDTSKAVGPDQIGNRILKECAESLCILLSILFKKSLDEGIFPDLWKEAVVTAIFKKIDRQVKSNYRPISLLSCISKVLEKIVFNTLYSFLILNNLLSETNSGFKPNDSAIARLLAILESIYQGLDDHKDSIFVSLDISKAFDRVWHEGLIFKLKQNGVCGNLLSWFSSYLHNRSQRVVTGGCSSSSQQLHAGVPQGSILGPLLFLLYVNDMTTGLSSDVHQFADDTNLLEIKDSSDEAVATLNHDLELLNQWAGQWRVTFNPEKTFFMVISLKKHRQLISPILFDNIQITETNKLKSLGLTITNLSWNDHILSLISKASKCLFLLRKC